MNAVSVEVDPLPSRMIPKFHFPYRPSPLLSYALVFWPVLCIPFEYARGVIILIIIVLIFVPTIYFAVQCIVRTSRSTYGAADSDNLGKKAAILSGLWFLLLLLHLSLLEKFNLLMVLFVLALPGSGGFVMMLYIALRYATEKCARELSNHLSAPTEAEAPPSAADAELQPLLAPSSQFDIYRPSKTLLVVSILFACGSWVTEALTPSWRLTPTESAFWGVILMWIYVPLIWLQACTLKRAFQGRAPTLVEEGGIGDYTMDLAAMFVGTKSFIYLFATSGTRFRDPLYASWAIQIAWWIIQVCLVVYTAVRYAVSFSRVIPRYLQAERRNEISGDASQAPVPEPLQPHDSTSASST